MNSETLPVGTQNAPLLPALALTGGSVQPPPVFVAEVLESFGKRKPFSLPMLRSTVSLLTQFIGQTPDEMLIDKLAEKKPEFGAYLKTRKYARNSAKSYVNYARMLLMEAKQLGWAPDTTVPVGWLPVLDAAEEHQCIDIVRDLARKRVHPRQVTIDDVNAWGDLQLARGKAFNGMKRRKMRFWRLLKKLNCTEQTPICLVREQRYGVRKVNFPPSLRAEVDRLLKWKLAPFALDRPKDAQLRPSSARMLADSIEAFYGFAVNVAGLDGIQTLAELIRKPLIGAYMEWALSERLVKGKTLKRRLGSIAAAMIQHPDYRDIDLTWCKPLSDSIPESPESEAKRRKAEKYIEYAMLETIPAKIRSQRAEASQKSPRKLARVVMDELLIQWLLILPWRQRNIRECRISGANPNVFRGPILAYSELDPPNWVKDAITAEPKSEFWQIRFSGPETKTGIEIHALVPRQLIKPLEEYLGSFRSHLLFDEEPNTLFVSPSGKMMTLDQVAFSVSQLTLQHAGKRMTPHLFRDSVAYAWLKAHPQDFLTLSKLLWHSNVNTTLQTYGSRFNESSGVSAMEAWLDERKG